MMRHLNASNANQMIYIMHHILNSISDQSETHYDNKKSNSDHNRLSLTIFVVFDIFGDTFIVGNVCRNDGIRST